MARSGPEFGRPAPALSLDFDPEAAEEKALVRLRQASASAPGRLYALRSGGAVLEVVAATIAIGGAGVAAFLLTGTGDVLESPRPAVAFAVFLASALTALMIAVAGQLLVAQAAVARNTQLMTSILAEMNHTVTAGARPSRQEVVITTVPDAVPTAVSAT